MKETLKLLSNHKFLTLVVLLLTSITAVGMVGSSMTLAPLTDALIAKNLNGVIFWLLLTIGIWVTTLSVNYINSLVQAQIVRYV